VPHNAAECIPMKIKIRSSKTKRQKQHGFRSRQKTKGGRKTNRRQRARHGSF
jgi:ribosomal protein L34